MKIKIVLLGAMLMFLFSCSSPYNLEQEDEIASKNSGQTTAYESNPYSSGGNDYAGNEAGVGDFYQDPLYGVNVVGGPEAGARDRVIYFSFDSTSIDTRSENVILEHARYLQNNPQAMVILEGHTDERGTREYNIGLGERRAYAVKYAFQNAGVDTKQMRVLSYGEERPAVWGSDEISYAKNRRVVIIY